MNVSFDMAVGLSVVSDRENLMLNMRFDLYFTEKYKFITPLPLDLRTWS